MVTPSTECVWNRDRLRGMFGWPGLLGKLDRLVMGIRLRKVRNVPRPKLLM